MQVPYRTADRQRKIASTRISRSATHKRDPRPPFLWMVGAKLRPIAVRRRVPSFESLLFRSLILAAIFGLAASRGLNRPAGAGAGAASAAGAAGAAGAGAWRFPGCGDHRIHFLGKGSMAGVRTHVVKPVPLAVGCNKSSATDP